MPQPAPARHQAQPSQPQSLSLQRTLDQHRAASAYQALSTILANHRESSFPKELKSRILKLPTLILTNGLGATLAFLTAKGKGKGDASAPETALLNALSNWLIQNPVVQELRLIPWPNGLEANNLLERIIKIDSETYRHVTMEALAWSTWLKRFAEGMIESEN